MRDSSASFEVDESKLNGQSLGKVVQIIIVFIIALFTSQGKVGRKRGRTKQVLVRILVSGILAAPSKYWDPD